MKRLGAGCTNRRLNAVNTSPLNIRHRLWLTFQPIPREDRSLLTGVGQAATSVEITREQEPREAAARAQRAAPVGVTVLVLLHVKPPELVAHHTNFWRAYGGEPELTTEGQFRLNTYMAVHASTAVLWANRHADEQTLKHASRTLDEAASHLTSY